MATSLAFDSLENLDINDHIRREKELLVYLDRTGNLPDCHDAYVSHAKEKKSYYFSNGFYRRFDFSVSIDPEIFFELTGDLAYMFVNQVDQFKLLLNRTVANYVKYLSLKQDSLGDESHESIDLADASALMGQSYYQEDLEVWIELTSDHFPDPHLTFKPHRPGDAALQKLTGCLVHLTAVRKHEKSKLFKCESKPCHYQKRVKHGREVLSCLLTGHAMQEVPRATEVVEYWDGKFLYRNNCLPLAIRIPTRITNVELQLGQRYNLMFHFDLHASVYSAWYISEAVSDLRPFLTELPESIRTLRAELEDHCSQSTWTLVHFLSAELCASVAPKGIFHNLKMGLLLSLASMRCSGSKPAPVFCLGPEATHLVRVACTLAHHSIDMTTNPTSQGCVEGGFSEEELSAGPLHMARDGICYLGEWSKYGGSGKHSPGTKVLKALEDGYISMTNQGKSHLFPMNCSVWTTCYWVPNTKNKKNVDLKVIFENFGMPFILDFSSESEMEKYVSFILKKSMLGGHRNGELVDEYISRDDFKQYLEIVKTIEVEVDPNSKEVISNYFVATRRSRPECSFPIASISKLSVLAESHARLRLSPVVTYEDAVAVIRLYEQSMDYVYGKSICTTVPLQMEMDFENPSQIHNTMIKFSLWLDKYIRTYIRGSSIMSRDDDLEF